MHSRCDISVAVPWNGPVLSQAGVLVGVNIATGMCGMGIRLTVAFQTGGMGTRDSNLVEFLWDSHFIKAAGNYSSSGQARRMNRVHLAVANAVTEERDGRCQRLGCDTAKHSCRKAVGLEFVPLTNPGSGKGIDLEATLASIHKLDAEVRAATAAHNAFLAELGLPLLP